MFMCKQNFMYDVIIIGGGPAGLTAAIYCARAKLKTLVLDKDESALKRAHRIENYFGIESISGEELLETGKTQALQFGAEIRQEEALSIIPSGEGYVVETANNKYEAKAVILAVGVRRSKPEIKNIEKFEGKGISYCAICDAFFFKNKTVAVLGNSDYTIKEAMELREYAKKVYILTNGKELNLSPGFQEKAAEFEVIRKRVIEVFGKDSLEGIRFENGKELRVEGFFIATDPSSPLTLARKLGLRVENGIIVTDKEQSTGIPGIFACGDCTSKEKQLSIAVGEGAKAGLSVIKYVRGIK